jgi:hypothetical protein
LALAVRTAAREAVVVVVDVTVAAIGPMVVRAASIVTTASMAARVPERAVWMVGGEAARGALELVTAMAMVLEVVMAMVVVVVVVVVVVATLLLDCCVRRARTEPSTLERRDSRYCSRRRVSSSLWRAPASGVTSARPPFEGASTPELLVPLPRLEPELGTVSSGGGGGNERVGGGDGM